MKKNNIIAKNKKNNYLEEVENLIEMMISLSNKGMKEIKSDDFLVLCGIIRDCAFKIKKTLKKNTEV